MRLIITIILCIALVGCSEEDIPKGMDKEYYNSSIHVIDISDSMVKNRRNLSDDEKRQVQEYVASFLLPKKDIEKSEFDKSMIFLVGVMLHDKLDMSDEKWIRTIANLLADAKLKLNIK